MKKIAALLPLALLSACASDQPSLQTERTYRVEWIGERPLIDRSYLTVTLGEDNRAYGNAGCNHWFGGELRLWPASGKPIRLFEDQR